MSKDRAIDWLPTDQHDVARAQALMDRTVAELGPIVSQLIPWLRNDAWPVAAPVAGALRKVGSGAVSTVSRVLRGEDPVLKRNVIKHIVSSWPSQDVSAIHGVLGELVSDSQSWGADLEALKLLLQHSLIDSDAASQWIAFKRQRYVEFMQQLDELARLLP